MRLETHWRTPVGHNTGFRVEQVRMGADEPFILTSDAMPSGYCSMKLKDISI